MMNSDNLNKRICSLDRIINITIETSSLVTEYKTPNQLQATQLFMNSVPVTQLTTSTSQINGNIEFLTDIIKKMFNDKGFKSNFDTDVYKITNMLNNSEYELSPEDKKYASLIKNYSNNYPTYKREKLEEVFSLKRIQVDLITDAFNEFTKYVNSNNIDINYKYVDTLSSTFYDDKTTHTFIVDNCFETCAESIKRANDIVLAAYNKDVVEQAQSMYR